MSEQANIFDERFLKEFKVGDLVSWKHLNDQDKEYGFIQEIYSLIKLSLRTL